MLNQLETANVWYPQTRWNQSLKLKYKKKKKKVKKIKSVSYSKLCSIKMSLSGQILYTNHIVFLSLTTFIPGWTSLSINLNFCSPSCWSICRIWRHPVPGLICCLGSSARTWSESTNSYCLQDIWKQSTWLALPFQKFKMLNSSAQTIR